MRCPTLDELPPPPAGKTGWPWTEESPRLPDTMPDGRPWPRISVVTPNYNYGGFIEETIRSVLLQGYPDLEHIVIDGGSSDGSLGVIHKYSRWLAGWVSEPDRGQAHAINKGFARATGHLLAWMNSDDMYLPEAFGLVAQTHACQPAALLMGDVEHFAEGEHRRWVVGQRNVTFRNLTSQWTGELSFHPAGVFVPRALYACVGPLDEALRYTFDHDWLCRLIQRASPAYLGVSVARFRVHATAKTTAEIPAQIREGLEVTRRHGRALRDQDEGFVVAMYGIREAAVYLGYHARYARFWSRARGLRCLFSALWRYPRIVSDADFRRLCLRGILPKRLLRSSPWRSRSASAQPERTR